MVEVQYYPLPLLRRFFYFIFLTSIPPYSLKLLNHWMPRRKSTRRRPTRRRKHTFKRRRRSLYRGRRVQSITKPLVISSRFRKVFFNLSLPHFTVTPDPNSGGLCLPIRLPIDNIYDPLAGGITINPLDFTVLDLPTMAPGYTYGPCRGHDILSQLFRQYRVIGMNAQAKFQNDSTFDTATDIGMKLFHWGYTGLSMHLFPRTYYDLLEQFGPIPTRNTAQTTKPIYTSRFGRQGKINQLTTDSLAPDYTLPFHVPKQATHITDDLYLSFYTPEIKAISGNLELQLTYYVQCQNPNTHDDTPVALP